MKTSNRYKTVDQANGLDAPSCRDPLDMAWKASTKKKKKIHRSASSSHSSSSIMRETSQLQEPDLGWLKEDRVSRAPVMNLIFWRPGSAMLAFPLRLFLALRLAGALLC